MNDIVVPSDDTDRHHTDALDLFHRHFGSNGQGALLWAPNVKGLRLILPQEGLFSPCELENYGDAASTLSGGNPVNLCEVPFHHGYCLLVAGEGAAELARALIAAGLTVEGAAGIPPEPPEKGHIRLAIRNAAPERAA